MKRIMHVVGARPNFMKASPVLGALSDHSSVDQTLVHTGQHYDLNMSDIFFDELSMPLPDFNLGVGSGSHADQTAGIMKKLDALLAENRPDLVVVYGDVNSTVASSLVCSKLGIPVGHVEAGLRSFDRRMPEELNRLVTDQLSDHLFTPSTDAKINLIKEGIHEERIYEVGNVMIDSLVKLREVAAERRVLERQLEGFEEYGLVTVHRPSNVDEPGYFECLLNCLNGISKHIPLVFPVHPRTKASIDQFPLNTSHLIMTGPLGYLDFLALQMRAKLVITDSGGIQEETTYLGIPCLTIRDSTERPVTVTSGTNILVGRDLDKLTCEVESILSGNVKKGNIPPLRDGEASLRIAAILESV